MVTGRSHTGRRIASPTSVGILSFGRIPIGDGINVHGIRIMSGSAHIAGSLGARVIKRGGHGGRALSRGTVGEHLEGKGQKHERVCRSTDGWTGTSRKNSPMGKPRDRLQEDFKERRQI